MQLPDNPVRIIPGDRLYLRDQVHRLGAKTLEAAAEERQKRAGYEGASFVCKGCSGDARFVQRRGKTIKTLMGYIAIQRPYYHCPECQTGYFPWDQTLGLDKRGYAPAAQEIVAMGGTLVSFPKASEDTVRKMSGLRISESTALRITEDAGARLKALRDARQTFGPQRCWTWQRDARGRTCGCVSVDAVSIRQQGPQGAKAEGRMAYVTKLYSPRIKGCSGRCPAIRCGI